MGDRLRKYTKQLGKLAFRASFPALLIYGVLIGSFVVRGTPHNDTIMPLMYLRLLAACYLTAFIVTCVLHYKEMIHAVLRSDEQLIGNNFGASANRTSCSAPVWRHMPRTGRARRSNISSLYRMILS